MLGSGARSVFLIVFAVCFAFPTVGVAIVLVCIAGQTVLAGLHLMAAVARPRRSTDDNPQALHPDIFFSVHVASHDEPPEVVARTLSALATQRDAPPFEVIVLDNNTPTPARWEPVATLCAALGPRFRFYHEMNVQGAKAGALNIALARTDPRATHVVILDADYQSTPDFLAIAAAELSREGVDYLQFPQAYRNEDGCGAGVSRELADYFLRHARQADGADAMLLTGTLSVIRRTSLEAAGGWSGRTITEDAELGLRLQKLGCRGRFIDRVVGRGLLPLSLQDLAAQRYRWAAGNLSTMVSGLSGLGPRVAIPLISQLTAWVNLSLPMAAALIGGTLALQAGSAGPGGTLVLLAAAGLVLACLASAMPMVLAAMRDTPGWSTLLSALAARVALIVPSAMATFDVLTGRQVGFVRTSKDLGGSIARAGPERAVLAVAGLACLVSPDLPLIARLGAVLLILPYPLALHTEACLASYRSELSRQQEAT